MDALMIRYYISNLEFLIIRDVIIRDVIWIRMFESEALRFELETMTTLVENYFQTAWIRGFKAPSQEGIALHAFRLSFINWLELNCTEMKISYWTTRILRLNNLLWQFSCLKSFFNRSYNNPDIFSQSVQLQITCW